LVELLICAERPVIIAGAGAIASDARNQIISLASRTGALLATSLQAKGLFDGEEFNAGIAGGFVCAPSERLFQDADVVLGVGAELGFYTLEGGRIFPNATVARIDIDPPPPAQKNVGLHVRGDARETVAALNRVLAEREIERQGFRTSKTREILNSIPPGFERPSDGLDPRLLARSLSAALPADSVVTCGVGHFWGFVAMYTTCPTRGKFHFSHQFGAIGQTLPLAIGIAVGAPEHPHVVVEGDGSLMMHLQEFETLVRYGLPMILIVWNDSGFGAEAHKLRLKGFDAGLAQWRSPDFVAVAKSFGGDGVRLESEDQIGNAIARGLEARKLFVIDARVSPSTVSDLYLKTHFGAKNRAPLLQGVRSHPPK
jgi:thiamine pyrophosphate-dependent acetolactate synthase large subunit-like protein